MTIDDIKKMNLDILVAKYKKALFLLTSVENELTNYIKYNFNDIDTISYIQQLNNGTYESFANYLSSNHKEI